MNCKKEQKKTKKKPNKCYFLYDFVKITGAIPVLFWLRLRVIVYGKQNPKKIKGGVLISSNHVSFTDPVLIHCVFWRRRLHCLATKDLYRNKLLTFFFNHMHCIQVDKENFSMNSLHEVCDDLKRDKAVLIFPEGQVNRSGSEMLGLKSGVVLMAYRAKKPILPTYIVTPEKPHQRRTVLVGDPIHVHELVGKMPSMEDFERVSAYLREKELELRNHYYEKENKQ
jgi:1-acyl-sn-glycerol-3-phosphate acyltransferase